MYMLNIFDENIYIIYNVYFANTYFVDMSGLMNM